MQQALLSLVLMAGPQATVSVPQATPVAAPAPVRSSQDLTKLYQSAFAHPAWPQARLDKLRRYKLLLVPGFMANGIFHRMTLADKDDPAVDLAEDQKESKEQFGALRDWLDQGGVSEELVAINSRQTSAFNAKILAAAIKASDKPVLFVTHSKGGKDLLETLLSGGDPTGKVAGWVSIQTPFYGSPVGDFWVNHPAWFKWASLYLIKMGGDPGALTSLTQKESRDYLAAHQAGVDALVAGLPILSFASWKAPEGAAFDTKLKVFRDMMWRKGIQNDGMVPTVSAKLAGTDFVTVPGVDHNATVEPTVRPLDRLRFSKALLALLLDRLP